MEKHYIRFRYIPIDLMFTPLYMISVDHIQVEVKASPTEYDLQVAVCESVKPLIWNPDHVRIEQSQKIDVSSSK